MTRPVIIALALLTAGSARADEWTALDTAGEVAFATTVALDYGQTRWFLTHSAPAGAEPYYEKNPILGRRPSQGKLAVWCATSILGHAAISYALPQPWRRFWQAASFVFEGTVVAGNASVVGGVKLAF